MQSQPHTHKVAIYGNHDLCGDPSKNIGNAAKANAVFSRARIHHLHDSGFELMGLNFYGSAYTPEFYDWAWMEPRSQLAQRWRRIPEGTDILVTHGPPHSYGDLCLDGRRAGCEALRDRVKVIKPLLHVFGHIHEGAGMGRLWVDGPGDEGHWVNASVLNRNYEVAHRPAVVDLEPRARQKGVA